MNEIKGIVRKGLGKARGFIEEQNYDRQFTELLGFKPFPGTLNLQVNEKELKEFLERMVSVTIKGFEKNGEKFGALKCFKAMIKEFGYYVIIVVPEKARHKNMVEIIDECNLKERLGLKDGQEITLGYN